MDTEDFDSQSKQHLNFYNGFMSFMMVSAVAIAVVLLLMATFLL